MLVFIGSICCIIWYISDIYLQNFHSPLKKRSLVIQKQKQVKYHISVFLTYNLEGRWEREDLVLSTKDTGSLKT